MKASDEGGRSDTAQVIITIQKDEQPPYFVNAPYTFKFDDSRNVGDNLYTGIIAQDVDGTVSDRSFLLMIVFKFCWIHAMHFLSA